LNSNNKTFTQHFNFVQFKYKPSRIAGTVFTLSVTHDYLASVACSLFLAHSLLSINLYGPAQTGGSA